MLMALIRTKELRGMSKKDLEKKLQEFKGIGPVTVRIFLRDLSLIKSTITF